MSNYPDFNCLRITPLEGQIVERQLHRHPDRLIGT